MSSYSLETWAGILISSWMSMSIAFMTYIVFTNDVSHLFAVGPNPEFSIFGIVIDTFPKYGVVISFCFINSGIRAINGNALHSWIINEIQDVTRIPVNIGIGKACSLSFISIIYNWFDFFMYINILLSQIDMLLVEIFADLIVTGLLTIYYLRAKTTSV
uniref:Uncharacterized protein n=1 Tax=viral metagenome TaxID=1070528 RepID=A0A6C0I3T0_9ZZZZ